MGKSAQTPQALSDLASAGRVDPLIKNGNLHIDNVNFEANNGEMAKQVAESGNSALKKRVLKSGKARKYLDGLQAAKKQSGDQSAARAEAFNVNATLKAEGKITTDVANVQETYGVDSKGNFESDDKEKKFKEDLKKNADLLPKIASQLKGMAQFQAFSALTKDEFTRFVITARAGSAEDKKEFKALQREYTAASKKDTATDDMKDVSKWLSGLPV